MGDRYFTKTSWNYDCDSSIFAVSERSTNRFAKQNLEIERLTVAVTIHLRVASILQWRVWRIQ